MSDKGYTGACTKGEDGGKTTLSLMFHQLDGPNIPPSGIILYDRPI